uniref:Dynamin-type G domain-containing protein n=1 Tax=Sinocyclocheilus anshuiensis TaxID=1608454 RepID=A0A671PN69_9TELE
MIDSISELTECCFTAQNELAGKGVGICDELITLEIMSPDMCDLTLIDLPGITRVPVNGQPEGIGKQIKRLIMKYINKRETINLVVVPCNTDIATAEALKLAQEVDPEGKRTLAILTKPDLIDKGTEKSVLAIVHNEVVPLRKGYIMVKCRGQQQIDDDIPLEEAAQMERDFFQNHDYFRCLLEMDKATIKCLAVKLTQDLVDHIKKSLPQIHEQIKKQLWSVKRALRDCEDGPPEDLNGAKEFLIKLSENYRGRELLSFSNYRMIEEILQDHVAKLKDPAVYLLIAMKGTTTHICIDYFSSDKINNIQLTQLEKAEQRISEQFEMENRIYIQDAIFLKILSEITNKPFSEKELPIVVQRIADKLPLMITFYMLQETPDVHELLSEDSDVSKRCKDLRARLNRLTTAEESISYFFND